MSHPVYDCGVESCEQCCRAFRTVEGLTAIVIEEARSVISAEADMQKILAKQADAAGWSDARIDVMDEAFREAEQDMIAMIVRLGNAMLKLDARSKSSIDTTV